jgi:hypothetical protein
VLDINNTLTQKIILDFDNNILKISGKSDFILDKQIYISKTNLNNNMSFIMYLNSKIDIEIINLEKKEYIENENQYTNYNDNYNDQIFEPNYPNYILDLFNTRRSSHNNNLFNIVNDIMNNN